MNICSYLYNFNLLKFLSYFEQFYDNQSTKSDFKYIIMKILSIAALLLMLTNCAGGNVAKIKLGKKCTVADSKQIQESSLIWFVSKEALDDFDKRINKKHCLNS
jgi:uncharacterized lipoprotein YajG